MIALAVALALGAAAWVVAVDTGGDPECAGWRVTRAAWTAAAPGEERRRLADRIVDCRALTGWSRARVRRVLGRPRGAPVRTRSEWSYATGVDSFMEPTLLVVAFDRDRVREATTAP